MRYWGCLLGSLVFLLACQTEEALPDAAFSYVIIDNETDQSHSASAQLYPDGSLSIQSQSVRSRVLLYAPTTEEREHELSAVTYAHATLRDPRLGGGGVGTTNTRTERQGFVRIDDYDAERGLVSGAFSFIARVPLATGSLIVKEGRFDNLRVSRETDYYSGGQATVTMDGTEQRTVDITLSAKPAYLDIELTLNDGADIRLHLPATLGEGTHTFQHNRNLLSRPYLDYQPRSGGGYYLADTLDAFTVEEWNWEAGRASLRFDGKVTYASGSTTRPLALSPLRLNW